MSNRIFNRLLITGITIFSLFTASNKTLGALTLSEARKAVNIFLSEAFPKQKILSAMKFDAKNNIVSVIHDNGAVFSLYLIPVTDDDSEFENVFADEALFFARNNLAFTIGQSKTDRNLYVYDEPLGFALSSFYSRPRDIKIRGIETTADIITSGKTKIAAALAWVSPESANIFDADIPSGGVLNEDYCRMLYTECAGVLFRNGFYSEALPMFRNIHRLKWAKVNAYIDAAECFLRTNQPSECAKLLTELISILEDKMTVDDFIRAGRLFRSSGDRQSALSAFKLAKKRYREGQSKQ